MVKVLQPVNAPANWKLPEMIPLQGGFYASFFGKVSGVPASADQGNSTPS